VRNELIKKLVCGVTDKWALRGFNDRELGLMMGFIAVNLIMETGIFFFDPSSGVVDLDPLEFFFFFFFEGLYSVISVTVGRAVIEELCLRLTGMSARLLVPEHGGHGSYPITEYRATP
jgi:hypothetical protein